MRGEPILVGFLTDTISGWFRSTKDATVRCHTLFPSRHRFFPASSPPPSLSSSLLNGERNRMKENRLMNRRWTTSGIRKLLAGMGSRERCHLLECRGKQTLRNGWKHLEVITEEKSLVGAATRTLERPVRWRELLLVMGSFASCNWRGIDGMEHLLRNFFPSSSFLFFPCLVNYEAAFFLDICETNLHFE